MTPRRVLVAPDKFKGSLTAAEVAEHIARGVRAVLPDAEVHRQPVADGGEGTVDAVVAAGMARRTVTVTGPLGDPVRADFAVGEHSDGPVAVVELAQASGLLLLGEHSDPLRATSRGTGELLLAAAAEGARTIVLALGGSACTDGGAGLLAALGATFAGADGAALPDGGGALTALARVDLGGVREALGGAHLVLASDVDNPLLGPDGAAAVYGPQKGAGPPELGALEAGLHALVRALSTSGYPDASEVAERPGAGAAGGVGFGAMVGLGARRRPGFDVIAELVGFDRLLDGVDLVITGEGSLDVQSLHGKAPVAVAARAAERGIPVVALCGVLQVDATLLAERGLGRAWALSELEPDPARCMSHAGELLERLTANAVGQA